ncbi:MAG TPA: hypothetical protein VGP13_04370 [Candidatus Paceibacterota bacterium]|jgi:hypothetical protein|nr:hypothetical protein [Candidatus Paceibacterota bacterium]
MEYLHPLGILLTLAGALVASLSIVNPTRIVPKGKNFSSQTKKCLLIIGVLMIAVGLALALFAAR